jgi:outer membrane protein assembly factor BamB
VVGDLEGYLHWISRRDGRIVGRVKVAGGAITAQPLVSGGRLFVYADDGTLAALSTGAVSAEERAKAAAAGGGGGVVSAPDLPSARSGAAR